jgi:hypothetical protein
LFSCFTNARWSAVADVRITILVVFLDSCVLVEKGAEERSGVSWKQRKSEAFGGIFGFSCVSSPKRSKKAKTNTP